MNPGHAKASSRAVGAVVARLLQIVVAPNTCAVLGAAELPSGPRAGSRYRAPARRRLRAAVCAGARLRPLGSGPSAASFLFVIVSFIASRAFSVLDNDTLFAPTISSSRRSPPRCCTARCSSGWVCRQAPLTRSCTVRCRARHDCVVGLVLYPIICSSACQRRSGPRTAHAPAAIGGVCRDRRHHLPPSPRWSWPSSWCPSCSSCATTRSRQNVSVKKDVRSISSVGVKSSLGNAGGRVNGSMQAHPGSAQRPASNPADNLKSRFVAMGVLAAGIFGTLTAAVDYAGAVVEAYRSKADETTSTPPSPRPRRAATSATSTAFRS